MVASLLNYGTFENAWGFVFIILKTGLFWKEMHNSLLCLEQLAKPNLMKREGRKVEIVEDHVS